MRSLIKGALAVLSCVYRGSLRQRRFCVCRQQHQLAKQQKSTRYRTIQNLQSTKCACFRAVGGNCRKTTEENQEGTNRSRTRDPGGTEATGMLASYLTQHITIACVLYKSTACRSCIRDLPFNPINARNAGILQSATIRPTGPKYKEPVLMHLSTGEHERNEDRITLRAFIRLL